MPYQKRFMNQTDLGRLFGVTSHVIGRRLTKAGLKGTIPTPQAIRDGYAVSCPIDETRAGWYWVPDKVVPVLLAAGHELVSDLPQDLVVIPDLHGPFEISQSDPRVILNANGTMAFRAASARNARAIYGFLVTAERVGALARALAALSSG